MFPSKVWLFKQDKKNGMEEVVFNDQNNNIRCSTNFIDAKI